MVNSGRHEKLAHLEYLGDATQFAGKMHRMIGYSPLFENFNLARIILEQPVLGAKILMELVLMLSQRLRQTSFKLVSLMEKEGN